MSGETMSESVTNPLSINDLPNELLVSVFNCLDFRTKVRAEQVCHKWREIVRTCLAISNLLFVCDDKRCQALNPFSERYRNVDAVCLREVSKTGVWRRYSLQSLMARYPNLKALHLSLSDTDLKRNVLRLISRTVDSDLRQISLTFDQLKVYVHSSEVSQFCAKYPNVRRFQLESIELNISETSVEMIIKMWRNLEVLLISTCSVGTERAFNQRPRQKCYFADISPNIRSLRMPGFMLDESAVAEMAKRAHKLENLEIFDLNIEGNIKSIAVIGDCLQSITTLDCSMFEMRDKRFDQTYATFLMTHISKLSGLKKLRLLIDSVEPILTFHSIRNLKRCSQLRSLSIESTFLTAECVEALSLFLPNLLSLKLVFVRFASDSDSCIESIKHFKYLRSLKLSATPELSDKSLTEILESSKTVRHLDVSFCSDITVDIALAAVKLANSKPEETIYLTVSGSMKQRCDEVVIPKNLVIKCNEYPILYCI